MENNVDIKKLWNKQTVPVSDWPDMLKKIERFKRSRIRKTINLNAFLLVTIVIIVSIWIYFEPQLVSTKIGIILSVLPMGIVIAFNHNLILLYKRIDDRQANSEYLNDLLVIKNRDRFMQTKLFSLYFILLSMGIGLYMYEYTWQRSMIFGVVAYLIMILWVVFNWFFLRPRIIKKNQRKMDDLILQIMALKSQIT